MRSKQPATTLKALIILLVLSAIAEPVHAQSLRRFSARFLKFDNTQFAAQSTDTVTSDNGIRFYDNEVSIPANVNTLFIKVSATGDVNGLGVAAWFTCMVDGGFCNPGMTFSTGIPGWISLLAGDDTEHGNNVNYTWCVPIKRKSAGVKGLMHEFELRMASNGNGSVYLEGINVFIDGVAMANPIEACKLMIAD